MFTKLESYSVAWLLNLCPSPDEQKVNLDITDDDDDEGDEENLTVEGCVVESCPVVGCQASQVQLGVVTRPRHGAGVTLEEVEGGALVEIFLWVFQHSEDDGLGGGEDDGQHPGHGHHQPEGEGGHFTHILALPGSSPLAGSVQGGQWVADADVPGGGGPDYYAVT